MHTPKEIFANIPSFPKVELLQPPTKLLQPPPEVKILSIAMKPDIYNELCAYTRQSNRSLVVNQILKDRIRSQILQNWANYMGETVP